MNRILLPFVIAGLAVPFSRAETVKDREGAVRQDKATVAEKDARWIYNDIDAGFAQAKKTGRPLLVVLRCVPCRSCMGLDAGLLDDEALAPLLDQFVCLRVINANALDLTRFQFDFDLSLTVMMFNGDGTVYGRFGSWTHQKNEEEKSTAALGVALKSALDLHRGYPGNREALAGKQGAPVAFKSPLEIPGLAGKYTRDLDWQGKVVPSCVHCHMIGDAQRTSLHEQKKAIPDALIFPQPGPESIGLTLAPDAAARVVAVREGSPAAAAGIRAGDDLESVAGQPLISAADLSWALHRAPDAGTLAAGLVRNGARLPVTLTLPDGWRRKADISRRVGTWGLRGMATGGLVLDDLPDNERESLKLGPDRLALKVRFVGQYGRHAAAKNAGWQKDDVLVELDGRHTRMSEGELIAFILGARAAGESADASVLRGGQPVRLKLPVQ